jgi:sulfonate transport system substrate-binding protein
MRTLRLPWRALALVTPIAALAACGSSGNGTSGSPTTTARAAGTAEAAATRSSDGKQAATAGTLDLSKVTLRVGDQVKFTQTALEAAGRADTPYKIEWASFTSGPPLLQALDANAIDIGGVGDAPPIFAASAGSKIKAVLATKTPEVNQGILVKDKAVKTVADLKGKKVAVTKGTDPYFFLLQSLATVGLSPADIEIVNLQHADGKTALERGDVDAWSGLDPFMAETIQQQGSRIIYRNPDFNSGGVLNVREDFISAHPDSVQLVVNTYEEARKWATKHPAELAALLASQAKVPLSVAQEELGRTALDISPVPDDSLRAVLTRVVPLAVADGDIKSEDAGRNALNTLFEPKFAQQAH